MSVLVPNPILHTLKVKAFLYDATIYPIVEKYDTIVAGLTLAVIVLFVIAVIFIILYKQQVSITKFYKECLNENFGWWKW